jgi:hypothetical protein
MSLPERRNEPRYVVEGLDATLDGVPLEILDLSATAIRVWWEHGAPPATGTLRFTSAAGRPKVRTETSATLDHVRGCDAIYRYTMARRDWPRVLGTFDTFADLHVDAWED